MSKEDEFKILQLLTSEDNVSKILGVHLALFSCNMSKDELADCLIDCMDCDLYDNYSSYNFANYHIELCAWEIELYDFSIDNRKIIYNIFLGTYDSVSENFKKMVIYMIDKIVEDGEFDKD